MAITKIIAEAIATKLIRTDELNARFKLPA